MLAVIETHPIQYHAPVYRAAARTYGVPLTAIYGSDFSMVGYHDAEFGATFAWDTDLLSGYPSRFLSRVSTGGAPNAETVTTAGLDAALREVGATAALVVGYSPAFHRDAWRAARRAGCAVIFRGETNDHANDRPIWKQWARDVALGAAYRTCATLLYVGRRSREHFERLGVGADRLVFSPYCVDTTPFQTDERARDRWRATIRQQLGAGHDDLVVLFSGKLSERKGIDVLVAAIKGLEADLRCRSVLVCLGDGAMRDHVEREAAMAPAFRAVVLGFHPQHQLSPYYHAADFLVLPSRHSETWGLVVNEALHHGLPCLVSDRVGCAPDLVDTGRTGFVAAAGSSDALAEAMRQMGAMVGRREVRDACRHAVESYTVDRAAAGLARAYEAVAGRVRA